MSDTRAIIAASPNTAPGEEGKLAIAMALAAQMSIESGGRPVGLADVPGFSEP